jgi:hypothetical protein
MTRRLALAVLAGVVLAAAVFLAVELAPAPAGGAVVTGPASWGAGAWPLARGASEGGAAATLAAATAPGEAGASPAPVAPAEVRAAPPALVAGPDGALAEVPSGLAGRRATRRGTAAVVPWDRVAVIGRVAELGKLARPVARGLAAARDGLGPCFAEERRALAAGRAPPFDPADPPTGPAVLILDLETRPGGVDVVSANVDSLGTSTAELAGCAVQALTGYAIDAPGAPAGKRFRLMHVLQ